MVIAGQRAARPAAALGAVMVTTAWLASVLALDGRHGTTAVVWLVASGWLVLAVFLVGESGQARWQCAGVLLVAGLVEFVYSAWLGFYDYRMEPVAPYVFPGHGVIFLAAVSVARAIPLARVRPLVVVTCAAAGALGLLGLLGGHADTLGAFWAVCFVAFALRGPCPVLYCATFWIALLLELAGVGVGAWAWAPVDPLLGIVQTRNPPSVPGGGYVIIQATGAWVGQLLLARRRSRVARGSAVLD